MPAIDWNARLDEKYRILAQNADADTIRANAAMVSSGAEVDKASGYVKAVANDYDINKQRFSPGGLEERIATERNKTELQRTAMDNAALAGVRGATASLYGQQAKGVGFENKLTDILFPSMVTKGRISMLNDTGAYVGGYNTSADRARTAGIAMPSITSFDPAKGTIDYGVPLAIPKVADEPYQPATWGEKKIPGLVPDPLWMFR